MLQSIRDRTQGWIAGVIVSLLILSFALWGIHSYLGGGSETTAVAKVNGAEITKNQLAVAYEQLRRQLQMQNTANYTLPLKAEAELKDRALQTLVNIQVLKDASIKQNYRISEGQVDSLLESMPDFQVNGQFSLARFQQVLSTTLYNAADFLNLLKTSLLIDQPRLGLIFSSFSLPSEVKATAALVNQEREIRYAVLSTQDYLKQITQIPAEKITAYYNAHQNDFKTPEQVSIEYIELSLNDLMAAIHPSDAELKAFYNENYKTEPFEKVKTKVRDAYVRQQAEEKFAGMRDKLANLTYEHPESLQTAAQALGLTVKSSELFTKEKGGKDISSLVKIREAAFSHDVLDAKNNSDVIAPGADAALVLRIKSHVPAALLPLQTVEKQITDKLKAEEAIVKTMQAANEIKDKLMHGASVDQIAQQYHLNWSNAGYIGRHVTKVDSAILNQAFAMPRPQQVGKSMYATTKVPNGYAIVALSGVRDGVLSKQDQYDVFGEQIQNAQGLLEYELYKYSLIKQSKITIENPQ